MTDLQRALRAELIAAKHWCDAMTEATTAIVWARAATAIANGVSADEVAELLGVSRATVYRHLARLHQAKES